MVLAMHGHPLARDHSRGEPQPEAEEVTDRGMQRESAVRLVPVEEDRDAGDRDVPQQQR
jgi:hypothetical protein